MKKLCQEIETLRAKVDVLRRHSLKETPTRTIVVDPLLAALGWDVRDPDEVQMEHPTVDGKSVDYALKINGKPVLLVEAKALDDPLNDVKAITQVVGYAANEGIVWCILTNGMRWQVYRSVEKCPAPEKLMFEVLLDEKRSEGVSIEQLARSMWRFSREEMAKGTLDELGEQTFTDGKVRKALDAIMRDPARTFLNLVKGATQDSGLSPRAIKESLGRIRTRGISGIADETIPLAPVMPSHKQAGAAPRNGGEKQTRQLAVGETYTEAFHTSGKPREVLEMYQAIDRLCFSLSPGMIEKRFRRWYIGYSGPKRLFCSVHLQQGGLLIWLRMKYGHIENPPSFARDVANVGHWGPGDVELRITELSQIDHVSALIRKSYENAAV